MIRPGERVIVRRASDRRYFEGQLLCLTIDRPLLIAYDKPQGYGLSTSKVQSIHHKAGVWTVVTLNNTYTITRVGDADDAVSS